MKIFAIPFLCAIAGFIPCVGPPGAAAQYYQPRTMPYAYQTSHDSNYYQNNYRRRVQFRNIRDDVLQINPAYTAEYNSAYVPGAYDGTVQADLARQLAELKAQYAALLAAQKAPSSPSPITVVPSTVPGQNPVVIVQQPAAAPGATQQPAQPPVVLPPAQLGPNGERPGIAILNAKCAKCHKAGSLSPGQQFTMLDATGHLTKEAQDPKEVKEILKRTYRKTMPPVDNIFGIPSVTDAEYALLVDALP